MKGACGLVERIYNVEVEFVMLRNGNWNNSNHDQKPE
jgi:hypothetical protein